MPPASTLTLPQTLNSSKSFTKHYGPRGGKEGLRRVCDQFSDW